MQSKISSSLFEPGDCKISAGSMFGGGVADGPGTVGADFFDFRDSVTTSLTSMR